MAIRPSDLPRLDPKAVQDLGTIFVRANIQLKQRYDNPPERQDRKQTETRVSFSDTLHPEAIKIAVEIYQALGWEVELLQPDKLLVFVLQPLVVQPSSR